MWLKQSPFSKVSCLFWSGWRYFKEFPVLFSFPLFYSAHKKFIQLKEYLQTDWRSKVLIWKLGLLNSCRGSDSGPNSENFLRNILYFNLNPTMFMLFTVNWFGISEIFRTGSMMFILSRKITHFNFSSDLISPNILNPWKGAPSESLKPINILWK